MNARKRIKVLIVDDSNVFREMLSRAISTDPNIEVVATAVDPFDARDKIIRHEPDVMCCDVEMPRMNGIEFIKRLLPQYPLPVIMVSTLSELVFDATNAGAVDFVRKPDLRSSQTLEKFFNELITKIKIASMAKIIIPDSPVTQIRNTANISTKDNRIIAIGSSTGGTDAIYNILRALPPESPGIVIVQHIPSSFSRMFAERLNRTTSLQVKEAESGDYLDVGRVLIAPGDQHMVIKKVGERYKVQCFSGEKVNGHCPSVDVLFESVAKEAGSKAVGVILTGMGYDGAKGLLAIRKNGGRTIGQDEVSSVVYGMPKVAMSIGAVEKQVSLTAIPQVLFSFLR